MRVVPGRKVKAERDRGGTPAIAAARSPLGLYVHVPFCSSTCDFCAFYQVRPAAGDIRAYLAGVEREAGLVDWPGPVTTVFWGGGTPGLLPPRDLAALAGIIRRRLGGEPLEWTVELAPASVTERRLEVLRDSGVTRISMGVQSFRPEMLEALGRKHTPDQVRRAYGRIRDAGFASVNIDLMFALPGQGGAELDADLDEAVALAPDHISTYCLTFEEDTALWVKLSQGKVKPDPALDAAMYERTWLRLAAAGYGQYEVANFARPGHECMHNLNTWRMASWVGLGPSAASQHGGWRGANESSLAGWLGGLERGGRMTQDRTELTPALLAEDALVFGLRMNEGVDLAAWRPRAPDAPWAAVEDLVDRLAAEGLLLRGPREPSRLRLTTRGRLLADSVGAELMAAFRPG